MRYREQVLALAIIAGLCALQSPAAEECDCDKQGGDKGGAGTSQAAGSIEKTQQMRVTVVSTDPESNMIIGRDEQGVNRNISPDTDALIIKNGAPVAVQDVVANDVAVVYYTGTPDNAVVKRIEIESAARP